MNLAFFAQEPEVSRYEILKTGFMQIPAPRICVKINKIIFTLKCFKEFEYRFLWYKVPYIKFLTL